MNTINPPLSNVQVELMKIYSTNISEGELQELKNLLAQFYAKKSIENANEVWKTNNFTNETMDSWLNEKS